MQYKLTTAIAFSLILSLALLISTSFIKRVVYPPDANICCDKLYQVASYGFPFIGITKYGGGFSGKGMIMPEIGLVFNFLIYLIIAPLIVYLLQSRTPNQK